MKRKLVVEVDCEEKLCGECLYMDRHYCGLFKWGLAKMDRCPCRKV